MTPTDASSVGSSGRTGRHAFGVLVDPASVLTFLADATSWTSQPACKVLRTSDREVAKLRVATAADEIVGHVRVIGFSRSESRVDYELEADDGETASLTIEVRRVGPRTVGQLQLLGEGRPAQLARGLVAVLAARFPPTLSHSTDVLQESTEQLWDRTLRPRVERLTRRIGR